MTVMNDFNGVIAILIKKRNDALKFREALSLTATKIVGEQQQVVPVDTSRLKNSLCWEWIQNNTLRPKLKILTEVKYAKAVEFGTFQKRIGEIGKSGKKITGMAPRPYFYPPIRHNTERLKERVKRL